MFLVAGLAFLSDSAALGILFLLLAAANLASTMSAQLDFVNQAGGRDSVKVSILEKEPSDAARARHSVESRKTPGPPCRKPRLYMKV